MSRSGEVGRQHLRNPGRRATSNGRPRQARHCRTRAAPRRTSRCRARSPADRGSRVEEDAGIERRADLDTAVGEALEQERRAAGEDREHDACCREALARVRQPCEVGALHLPRVPDRPAPPRGSARWDGAFGLGVHEEHAAGGIDLLEERRVRLRARAGPRRRPTYRRTRRGPATERTPGSGRPTRGRRRGCPRPRRARAPRARPARAPRARGSSGARRPRPRSRRGRVPRGGARGRGRGGRARPFPPAS